MEAIIREKSIKKPFKKLEINNLNSDNIVANFRQLLTKYKVHYNKLRNYHWSNLGSDCHELNKEFKDRYLIINNKINLIHYKEYNFNNQPQMIIEDALKNINKKEEMSLLRLLNQVKDILSDFGQLHDSMLNYVNTSINITDSTTKHLVAQFILRLEERN